MLYSVVRYDYKVVIMLTPIMLYNVESEKKINQSINQGK